MVRGCKSCHWAPSPVIYWGDLDSGCLQIWAAKIHQVRSWQRSSCSDSHFPKLGCSDRRAPRPTALLLRACNANLGQGAADAASPIPSECCGQCSQLAGCPGRLRASHTRHRHSACFELPQSGPGFSHTDFRCGLCVGYHLQKAIQGLWSATRCLPQSKLD